MCLGSSSSRPAPRPEGADRVTRGVTFQGSGLTVPEAERGAGNPDVRDNPLSPAAPTAPAAPADRVTPPPAPAPLPRAPNALTVGRRAVRERVGAAGTQLGRGQQRLRAILSIPGLTR